MVYIFSCFESSAENKKASENFIQFSSLSSRQKPLPMIVLSDSNISMSPDEDSSVTDRSYAEEDNENIYVQRNIRDVQLSTMKNTFLNANLNHKQGNILLKTFRPFPFHLISLPKDSRTFLSTTTVVASSTITQMEVGEYLHIGFKKI